MRVCSVIGHVVSTVKHPALVGRTILAVIDEKNIDDLQAPLQLAIDGIGAGPGNRVLVSESGAAGAEVVGSDFPPLRSVVIGIVD
jgi:microcompartment protein CcmK/EutM